MRLAVSTLRAVRQVPDQKSDTGRSKRSATNPNPLRRLCVSWLVGTPNPNPNPLTPANQPRPPFGGFFFG